MSMNDILRYLLQLPYDTKVKYLWFIGDRYHYSLFTEIILEEKAKF